MRKKIHVTEGNEIIESKKLMLDKKELNQIENAGLL
jgi:hypothetical protein